MSGIEGGGEDNQGGGEEPREILTPGGQATRGYLDPRGSSCQGVKINRYTGSVCILSSYSLVVLLALAWRYIIGVQLSIHPSLHVYLSVHSVHLYI